LQKCLTLLYPAILGTMKLRRSTLKALLWCTVWPVLGLPTAGYAETRKPAVAGPFYPAEAESLRQEVEDHLSQAVAIPLPSKPLALIAPHAGYRYSGPIAASAFKQVQPHAYDTVIVVGFTHRLRFDGIALDTATAYATPLGGIAVDTKRAEQLVIDYPQLFVERPEAFTHGEHSLEVMLPFLQVALSDFKLIPLMMGSANTQEAELLAEALAPWVRSGEALVVFSSDLSHYHPYAQAQALDQRLLASLRVETAHALARLFNQRAFEACGRGPLIASLFLAQRLNYAQPIVLQAANSGDTTGDKTKVVGYASVAFVPRESEANTSARLSAEAGQALVYYARWVLHDHYGLPQSGALKPNLAAYPELKQAQGIFVTLHKAGTLRGCIGRIATQEPLHQSLPRVALQAALEDPRFAPVTAEELEDIAIEVAVLSPPRAIPSAEAIVPGRDGVVLVYGDKQGVFLPSVWQSTGWTRSEFLSELAHQKAGLPATTWKHANLYTFQDQVFAEAP
jgi:AmmeMemoRadiSam system protein B/AmmeMemoRadiSam system protein A